MARTLSELQKQYNSSSSPQKPGGMPMGGPGRGPGRGGPPGAMSKSKPKNTKDTVKRLLKYVKKYRFHILIVAFCMLVSTITNLIGSFMLAPIINKITFYVSPEIASKLSITERISDNSISGFTDSVFAGVKAFLGGDARAEVFAYTLSAITILISVYLVGVIATYLQQRIMVSVSQGSLEAIRNDLFSKMQTLPVRFFDNHPTGEVMSRFTNDVDNIGIMLDNSLISLISGTITLAGTFVFMLTTNWILTLITVIFVPIFMKLGLWIASKSRKYYSGQQAALGAVNGYIEETVTGQKVIKVFNHEKDSVEEFCSLNDDLRQKQFKAQFYGGVMGPIMNNTSNISYAFTLGIGGILICLGRMNPGSLTVFAQYSKQFSFPINNISQQMTTVFSALAGAERVFNILDLDPEAQDGENSVEMPDMKGHIVLDNVSFGYNPDRLILKNISLYAKPGQKIAFVGSTGAGKTTVTNLLNRFYDIGEGTITIDGVDIKNIKRKELRKNIAMVLQDTHLFTGTVMENIRYGRLDATDDEVIAAAKTASAHSFIMRLSDGYNTILEGDGANLSQGQRQLLNIARAALSKAPILVLDEATSSVDTRTERHIEHGMDRLMKDRTTFVIAHRLSTVRNANAIMVLENGVIVERGDHDDLLNQKGRYYELYTGKKELD